MVFQVRLPCILPGVRPAFIRFSGTTLIDSIANSRPTLNGNPPFLGGLPIDIILDLDRNKSSVFIQAPVSYYGPD